MRKRIQISLLLLALGLIASGTAYFATTLGLDQNADWSTTRIALLLFGVTTMLFAGSYYKYADQIHSTINIARASYGGFPQQAITGLTIVIVIIIYIWFATSGRWTFWKSNTYYYDGLARGFLSGHLYLPIEPDQNLLELSNPYDPVARKEAQVKGIVDISFYGGKFYLYWGPVPAVILAAIYQVFREKIGDLIVAFSFICGIFLTQTALAHFLWRQYFTELPQWTLHISTLVIGLVGPLILLRHVSGSARIYEAAISGSQFFFMAGVLTAVPLVARYSISNWRLILAGFLWALAIGTRLTAAVPVSFITILLFFLIFKMNVAFSEKMMSLFFLSTPLLLGFLCLGWYNWARFGSFAETGMYYALAGSNFQINFDEMFSYSYIFQNIYHFLFAPTLYNPEFPFVLFQKGTKIPMFSFYSVPNTYKPERMAGVLYIFPFIIFSIVPLLMFFFSHLRGVPANDVLKTDDQKPLALITLGLGGAFMTSFGVLMMFFWAGMRYTGDFMPSLMTLSVIGFWQGYEFLQHKPAGKFYTVLAVALVGLSILIGMLLIISTDTGFIKKLI